MANLTQEEANFYRKLYKVISDPTINDLFVEYAKMKYNIALKGIRSKREDLYDYGYGNGQLDAWHDIIKLKTTITEVMKNI